MKKNSQKRKFGTILLSLAALFAVLFSTAACKTDSDDDELNSVTISPSKATINAKGEASLYANVDKKGSGTPDYKWEITSGGDYATLKNETSSTCVVTGKNTTASAQSVTVKCTVTFASTTKEAEATVTVSAAKAGLESVSIAGSAEIESTANTELTATPTFTIEGAAPTVTYTWEITAGSDYAELSESTTGTVTLTGKNTDTVEHEVTVKVTATYDGTTKDATTTVKILAAGQVVENKVTSVTVSAGKDSIACNGSTTLTATAEYSGNPEITYTWEITAGSDYAKLSASTTETVTLTAKNTDTEEHEVTVKVTATSDGTTKEATKTVKILAVENKVTSVTVSAEKSSIACDGSTTLTAKAEYSGTPTITYTWTISAGSDYAELSESTTGTATLTAKNTTTAEQTVTVKVSASDGTNSVESTCAVTIGAAAAVETGNVIKASDLPDGWAGINGDSSFGGYGASSSNIYTVSDYSSFISALKCGGKSYSNTKKIIYVSNEIDLNGGKTPYDYIKDAGKGGTYSSYEDWQSKFLATCIKNKASTLASDQSAFHNQQKKQSNIMIPSNTTIIGIADNAGFKNGTLYLKSVSNIVLRNLKVWDSLDYFPPWYQNSENNFNADMDCITVEGSTYVWIDHCTLGDTAHVYDTVSTPAGELSWVNYDALCDITKGSNYVTVSNCQFLNDDKVGLVGSTDDGTKFGDTDKLKVTFHHNYYNNVGQRLPRVRFGQVHVYNNNYDNVSSCCVVVGKSAQIYVENNYFSANAGRAFDVKDTKAGVTSVGNKFVTTKDTTATGIDANWIPSSVSGYVYNADSASDVPSLVNATTVGAGVWTVVK